ncbi:oxidoreductase [Rosenbergiella australiborealis]|uniref:Oxidoreductase n=1 Tax=Rosenbergiella australiborealis TaxID=1544696 RepID=A0ABS5T565_9GAMM|nr:oxidoreductase [Rosenbergiella australiborealis]MBT0726572.1 oxidoreductase [Rosenbergiella australiborealis]
MSESTPEKSPRLGVALIGYGFVGKTMHAPFITATEGLELVVVASSNSQKVHNDFPSVQVTDSVDAAITHPDVDLVVIASPNQTHFPLAKRALEAKKHVVVDKPFTLNLEDARELINLATQQQCLLSVFQNRRWDSDFLAMKTYIEAGKIGKVVHFESHIDRFRPKVLDRWREQSQPGSGLWFDIGPHLVDQALQLFGLPETVEANISLLREGAQADDWAHVILNYPNHRVILHCSMMTAGGHLRFVAHGTEGSLVKTSPDQQEPQLLAGILPHSEQWGKDSDETIYYPADGKKTLLPTPAGDQCLFYQGIYNALRNGGKNPVSGLEGLAVMAVIDAAFKASHSGQRQTLALSPQEVSQLD